VPWGPTLLILGAYLLGSFPTAYLLTRWRTGVDIRRVGSGNVGGSNVSHQVGTWAGVLVGVVDVLKGVVPVWLGLRLGYADWVAYVAGLAAVIGHDWSVWLRFQGGRGGATTLGVLLVAFPLGAAWIVAWMLVGAVTKLVAVFHLVGVATLPVLSLALGKPAALTFLCVALLVVMLVKRLEANQSFHTPAGQIGEIIWTRFLRDNDGEPH
jgi:glycerol-3-phosphate acyltransferase PlsY